MSATAGDDLIFASEFVETTTSLLQNYFTHSELPPSADLSQAMTRVQSGAKTLRARAIYQSAQSVLQAIDTPPVSESVIAGRLLALNKLVVQYADGLNEIYTADIAHVASVAAPQTDIVLDSPTPPANDYIAAKEALSDLLPLARKFEAANLTRLMTLGDRNQPIVQAVPVESVMRDIVEDALAIARISAKTISISYDVRQTTVTDDYQAAFQVSMSRALRAVILETLPHDKVGHIDMVADEAELCIKVSGPKPNMLPSGVRAEQCGETSRLYVALTPNLETPDVETSGDSTPKYKNDITATSPVPARMITDETEEALRAQLSELLDPGTVLAEVGA